MNERLKLMRSALKMTQFELADKAQIGRSTYAMFETGDRVLKDIHISALCSATGVSEKWLRTGEGEMFVETESNAFTVLCRENNLSPVEQSMLRAYLSLPTHSRAGVVEYFKAIVANAINDYEALRDELLPEPMQAAARHGKADNLAEAVGLLDSMNNTK